ncbi:MAG: TraB/GumN family protein, partial [Deltaproteobacteria bacterium]|nr:TraB/GumN family protein [Deltaproteobacteria bacterium]
MLFKRSKEKELKMIWDVEKDGSKSHLVGTAHFFPYSFKTSLTRCLENARIVMFEGPLDSENMQRVVNSGLDPDSDYHLFDDLDRKTIDKITRELAPPCRGRDTFMVLNLRKFRVENPLYDMIKGMKPWLAFFTIWSGFLKKIG